MLWDVLELSKWTHFVKLSLLLQICPAECVGSCEHCVGTLWIRTQIFYTTATQCRLLISIKWMPLSSITSIVMHNAQKGHEEIWQIWIIDWCQLESESLCSTGPVSIHTTPAESTAGLPVSIGFELNETLRTWIILWCFKKHACPISANMLNYIQHIKVMILRISYNCRISLKLTCE